MDGRRSSTLREHPNDRLDCWRMINREHFGALGAKCLAAGPLDAELVAYELGPVRLFMIEAPSHRVDRPDTRVEMPLDACYKLVLQIEGHAQIAQRERVFDLQPGDWSLYDPRVPYSITNFEHTRLLAVQIPRQLLKGFKVPELHTCEARDPSARGMNAVLGSFLRSLSEQLPTLPNSVSQPVSDTVLGLLLSTLATQQEIACDHASLPSVLKARVKQFVHTHLQESDLTLDRIAREMRCSKRYLHRVFEDEDRTVDRFVWLSRLERCRDALDAAHGSGKSIAEIAFAWGFNSNAHFCRLFKAQFGLAPRAYQRRGDGRLPN